MICFSYSHEKQSEATKQNRKWNKIKGLACKRSWTTEPGYSLHLRRGFMFNRYENGINHNIIQCPTALKDQRKVKLCTRHSISRILFITSKRDFKASNQQILNFSLFSLNFFFNYFNEQTKISIHSWHFWRKRATRGLRSFCQVATKHSACLTDTFCFKSHDPLCRLSAQVP